MYLLQMAKVCIDNDLNAKQSEVFIRAMLMVRPKEISMDYLGQLAKRFKDEFCLGDGFKFNGETREKVAMDERFPSRFDHIHLVGIAVAFNQVISATQPEQPLIPIPEKVMDSYYNSHQGESIFFERKYDYSKFAEGLNCDDFFSQIKG